MNRHTAIFQSVFRGIILVVFCCFWVSSAWAKKQTVFFNEEETLIVKVTKDGPVRISVKGDRLQDVMGLDESVTVEKDETHGLLYLRNIDKKQSITVITEGGTYQDITLVPEAGGVSVIVLKGKESEENLDRHPSIRASYQPIKDNGSTHFQTGLTIDSSFQGQVLMLIKQLCQRGGETEELRSIAERTVAYGLVAKPLRYLKNQGMRGEVYELVNTTETTLNLVEKDFYQVGDYALSIGKKQLERGEKTLLIVVRHD